jgi:hypothetical protein
VEVLEDRLAPSLSPTGDLRLPVFTAERPALSAAALELFVRPATLAAVYERDAANELPADLDESRVGTAHAPRDLPGPHGDGEIPSVVPVRPNDPGMHAELLRLLERLAAPPARPGNTEQPPTPAAAPQGPTTMPHAPVVPADNTPPAEGNSRQAPVEDAPHSAPAAPATDVMGTSDFQARLDSFTAPEPTTPLTAQPMPMPESSLALVATLVAGPDADAPAARPPAASAAPRPEGPGPSPAGSAAFVLGAQAALDSRLALERQRLSAEARQQQPAGPPAPTLRPRPDRPNGQAEPSRGPSRRGAPAGPGRVGTAAPAPEAPGMGLGYDLALAAVFAVGLWQNWGGRSEDRSPAADL